MSRKCSVCTSKSRALIDSRIANGETLTAIARDFQLSEDALSRHQARHARSQQNGQARDMEARLEQLWNELDAVYRVAAAASDHKAAIESLKQLVNIAEQLANLQKKETSSFEQMTTQEKVAYILADDALAQAFWDYSVRVVDGWGKEAAERERLIKRREEECQPACLRDPKIKLTVR